MSNGWGTIKKDNMCRGGLFVNGISSITIAFARSCFHVNSDVATMKDKL